MAAREQLEQARATGDRIPNPYTHDRAFTVSPADEMLSTLGDLLTARWGTRSITVLDPFSGGGSIPFEAIRYNFDTVANELNPVACTVLRGTLDYPFAFGPDLENDIRHYGRNLCETVCASLRPFNSPIGSEFGAVGQAYLWAHTVACPYTGKPLPLSPNWWLTRSGSEGIAARPVFDPDAEQASFEIRRVPSDGADFDPSHGTVRLGKGRSPWAHDQIVDGDHIKTEAQEGRMGAQLYCVAIKKARGGFHFRSPTNTDLEAVREAERELARRLPGWRAKGWVPDEVIPYGNKTPEPHRYGMFTWDDMFSSRQLLSLCSYVEAFHELAPRIREEHPRDRAEAILTYLGMVVSKAVSYNSRRSRWDGTRQKVCSVFDRHDFSFKWSFGEFDASRNLFTWSLDQVCGAYRGIAKLAEPAHRVFQHSERSVPVTVTRGSASHLSQLEDGSVELVVTDPPYYDNVMYGELSDYFYVWLKRVLGDVHPRFFADELVDKEDEAVASPARFEALGRKKRDAARRDYERKMAAAFAESHRVLRDDGLLTVMFTHKTVEAWDTLATSLLDAGFAIRSSWPVHTESEHSLHQARKNAAKSTIMLTCSKRLERGEPVWWDDIRDRVRRTARESAERFEKEGISGVDLYIATFGPTLAILSENWPVLTAVDDPQTGEPIALRPDAALDVARREVVDLQMDGLLGRKVRFDAVTDWYLLAWSIFKAVEFPADEARKLALAQGLDVETDLVAAHRILTKKGSTVALLSPDQRSGRGRVDPDADEFATLLDVAHTAMLLHDEEGAGASGRFLDGVAMPHSTLTSLFQALVNVVPRAMQNGKLLRPEARTLDSMRLGLSILKDLEAPPEAVPEEKQGGLDL